MTIDEFATDAEFEAYLDECESYEGQFDPLRSDLMSSRGRRERKQPVPAVAEREVLVEFVDEFRGLEGGFDPTYHPSRYEHGWLLSSLRTFYDQALILDVLSQVKGGKEASVYCCAAHPSTGAELLAAKVYRPRQFRSLRNDAMYREGRKVLTADGRPVKTTDHRVMRALGKKTAFGLQVAHTSWLMHEFTAMQQLYEAGGAVPNPIASNDNAILMSYHGDIGIAAPTLNEIRLDPEEAQELFEEVLRNVALMLQFGMVHGDLSAYNILYWEGEITLIDFPQVIDLYANRNARFTLERDIQRTCEYFRRQGVSSDPLAILEEFWGRYGVEYD